MEKIKFQVLSRKISATVYIEHDTSTKEWKEASKAEKKRVEEDKANRLNEAWKILLLWQRFVIGVSNRIMRHYVYVNDVSEKDNYVVDPLIKIIKDYQREEGDSFTTGFHNIGYRMINNDEDFIKNNDICPDQMPKSYIKSACVNRVFADFNKWKKTAYKNETSVPSYRNGHGIIMPKKGVKLWKADVVVTDKKGFPINKEHYFIKVQDFIFVLLLRNDLQGNKELLEALIDVDNPKQLCEIALSVVKKQIYIKFVYKEVIQRRKTGVKAEATLLLNPKLPLVLELGKESKEIGSALDYHEGVFRLHALNRRRQRILSKKRHSKDTKSYKLASDKKHQANKRLSNFKRTFFHEISREIVTESMDMNITKLIIKRVPVSKEDEEIVKRFHMLRATSELVLQLKYKCKIQGIECIEE